MGLSKGWTPTPQDFRRDVHPSIRFAIQVTVCNQHVILILSTYCAYAQQPVFLPPHKNRKKHPPSQEKEKAVAFRILQQAN